MFCPVCKAGNPSAREFCIRCGNRLPMIDLPAWTASIPAGELTENLLERLTSLEERFRRVQEAFSEMRRALERQEKTVFLNHNAILAMMEILSRRGRVPKEEIYASWEEALGMSLRQLGQSGKLERYRPRILALQKDAERDDFLRDLDEAAEYIFSGAYESGIDRLQRLLEPDSGNYELAAYIGEIAYDHGDLETSEKYLRMSLRSNPRQSRALLLLGVLLLADAAHLNAAVLRLRESFDLTQGAAITALCLGAALSMTGDNRGAMEHLDTAAREAPTVLAFLLKGRIHRESGDMARAFEALTEAASLDPDSAPARIALAQVLLQTGKNQQAGEELAVGTSLLEPTVFEWLDPPADFFIPRASDSVSADDVESALEQLERLLQISGNGSSRGAMERVLNELADSPNAVAVLAGEALRLGHEDLALQVALHLLDTPGAATHEMERAAALAVVFRASSDRARVKAIFEQHELEFSDPRARFGVGYLLALLLLRDFSDRPEAARRLSDILDISRENRWTVLLALGWISLMNGEIDEASRLLTDSLESNDDDGTRLLLAVSRALGSGASEAGPLLDEAWPLHGGVFPTAELLQEEVRSFDVKGLMPASPGPLAIG